MKGSDLRARLEAETLPDEAAAAGRARSVVVGAAATREPVRRRTLRPVPLALAALALAALIGALTPQGHAVADRLARAVERARPLEPAHPATAVRLPVPGTLLVTGPSGAWLLERDGTRRRLGAYADGAWSPHGRYLVLAHASELDAVTPHGTLRWSLPPYGLEVHDPRWSLEPTVPPCCMIAYGVGQELFVVGGDSAGPHPIALHGWAPAWRPRAVHQLAYAARGGQVRLATATGRILWRSRSGSPVIELVWSADGKRLLARTSAGLRLFTATGRELRAPRVPPASRVAAAAYAPAGRTLALLLVDVGRARSALVVDRPSGRRRTAFSAVGELAGLSWSPDGSRLLTGWPDADQWLVVPARSHGRVERLGGVRELLHVRAGGEFPRVRGWAP